MTKNQEIGQIGEEIAVKHLVKHFYRIIKRNHIERSDEIDIIALSKEGILIFCEVKTKNLGNERNRQNSFVAEDNLNWTKLKRIRRSAEFFVRKYPYYINEEFGWRIDFIAVDLVDVGEAAYSIRHYENL